MKNLLCNLDGWRERLQHEPLAVFLDYDGTLAAIAPTPAEARLPAATQETLQALVRLKNVRSAIISGRVLSDLKKMVPVKGIAYVGSHGMEFCVKGLASQRVSRQHIQELGQLRSQLQRGLQGIPGTLLEQKPFSLAIHYRKASAASARKAKRIIFDICQDALHHGRISIMSGKKVIEILPPDRMDKGRAVQRLWHMWGRKKYLPVFIGDDRTDEAAFDLLRTNGLTVRVGRAGKGSGAEYYVNDVDDVRTLLKMILCFRTVGL